MLPQGPSLHGLPDAGAGRAQSRLDRTHADALNLTSRWLHASLLCLRERGVGGCHLFSTGTESLCRVAVSYAARGAGVDGAESSRLRTSQATVKSSTWRSPSPSTRNAPACEPRLASIWSSAAYASTGSPRGCGGSCKDAVAASCCRWEAERASMRALEARRAWPNSSSESTCTAQLSGVQRDAGGGAEQDDGERERDPDRDSDRQPPRVSAEYTPETRARSEANLRDSHAPGHSKMRILAVRSISWHRLAANHARVTGAAIGTNPFQVR